MARKKGRLEVYLIEPNAIEVGKTTLEWFQVYKLSFCHGTAEVRKLIYSFTTQRVN